MKKYPLMYFLTLEGIFCFCMELNGSLFNLETQKNQVNARDNEVNTDQHTHREGQGHRVAQGVNAQDEA